MRTTFFQSAKVVAQKQDGLEEYLLEEVCIDAEVYTANSSIIFHVRVFMSALLFLYNFCHKFTKLNLYLLLILSSLRALTITSTASQRVINQIKTQKLPQLNVLKKNEHGGFRKGRSRRLMKVSLCIGVLLKYFRRMMVGQVCLKQAGLLTAGLAPLRHLHFIFHLSLGSPWHGLVTVL